MRKIDALMTALMSIAPFIIAVVAIGVSIAKNKNKDSHKTYNKTAEKRPVDLKADDNILREIGWKNHTYNRYKDPWDIPYVKPPWEL